MNDAIGLAGFYFTLIGFIAGLFFTRLDGWYGSVRAFHGKLPALSRREQFEGAEPERQGLAASAPSTSFAAVGILLTLLMFLAFLVPVQNSPVNPLLFVYTPMLVTVAAYWAGGLALLKRAQTLLAEAQQRIERGMRG